MIMILTFANMVSFVFIKMLIFAETFHIHAVQSVHNTFFFCCSPVQNMLFISHSKELMKNK